jgi:large subunit ribosomal protein L13
MKTYSMKKDEIQKKWYVLDLKDMVLGRAATRIASVLRGKHKPEFTPHLDMGDNVIVLNAEQVKVTGNKFNDKMYYHHSGYLGGLKTIPYRHQVKRDPKQMIYLAVKGMLPHNALGRKVLKNLKVYVGSEHPHQAQKPEPLPL